MILMQKERQLRGLKMMKNIAIKLGGYYGIKRPSKKDKERREREK